MDEVDLYNSKVALEQHLNEYFTSPHGYSIESTSIINDAAFFEVSVYTKAIPNSQIENDKYTVKLTTAAEPTDMHNLELRIKSEN